ncbi:MAG: glycoside hydrolase family 25 protein [Ruminococcus sp.]|nr:glycoside hydrolase family 25 protein [Ruminococcus sp.]
MKNFITEHKKIIMFSFIILLLVMIFTTAGIASPKKPNIEIIDDIKTCSIPEGKILAHGIDVSKYQGDIDFKKVKNDGYSFVIIRVGTSQGGKDKNFETYYKDAKAAGLDIGCYYYTYAYSAGEAKKEAQDVLSYIKGKTFTYPVFFDFEFPELLKYSRADENTKMINTFCKYIKRGGYYPGVYTSNSIYNNHIDNITLGSKWDFWIANYIDDTHNSDKFSKGFSMWQYSSNGSVSGINARVDLNVVYVDYPRIIEEFNSKLKKYVES